MTLQVLVAEDSPTQAAALQHHLEAAGYGVTLARDGAAALELAQGASFDLVLSDIVMPGLDGFELCRRIKADPELQRLPVVLLTSLADPMEVVRALEVGADNFLRKPYDPDQLATRLRTILVQRDVRAAGRLQMGVEILLLGRRFSITSERQQILDLLVATFEDLVVTNRQLRVREDELAAAQIALEEQLRAVGVERERLQGVLAALPEAMVIVDGHGRVTGASEASEHLLGLPPEQMVGRPLHEVCRVVDRSGAPTASIAALRDDAARGEAIVVSSGFDTYVARPRVGPVPVVLHAAPVRRGAAGPADVVVMLREVGGLAYHDPVTRLPNHILFADRLTRAVEGSAARGWLTALLVVKLDRVELVAETMGQAAGDQLLAAVAARLVDLLAAPELTDLADIPSGGHLGAGALGVAMPGIRREVDAVRFGHQLAERLSGSYRVADVEVTCTASVGVAVTARREPVADLLRSARSAAAAAEGRGGPSVEVFDPSTRLRTATWLRAEADLRVAIQRGQLRLHYQPEVALATGTSVGAEALARWQDPERGLVGPADFIPLAEETGLIVEIGRWALVEACRQAARWRAALPGGREFMVSVNLSARQLEDPQLLAHVSQTLAETGLDARSLVLEITESVLARDLASATQVLGRLRALGVRIGLDDFGTGYSSLLYVRSLPVDLLKVDRAFVAGIGERAEDLAVIRATVQLAHALGLMVVAEGVETEAQRLELLDVGCDLAQGHLFSRALTPGDLERWWRGAGRRTSVRRATPPPRRPVAAAPVSAGGGPRRGGSRRP